MDRDTTISYVHHVVSETYSIRWFIESLGNDTLGFVILTNDRWASLEKAFGKNILDSYFMPISLETKMFHLDFQVVMEILNVKEQNKGIPFAALIDFAELLVKEQELKGQKQHGEIDANTYMHAKKEIADLQEVLITRHGIKA